MKKQIDFDEIIDRRGTNATAVEAGCRANPYLPKNYVPMWIADMSFATPAPILDAMRARLDRRILGYSTIVDPAYYKAVTGWFQRRYGWEIDPDTLVFSSGIVNAVYAAVEHLTCYRDGVILMTPSYQPFDMAIRRYGRTPVYCPLTDCGNGDYRIDFEMLEALCKSPKNTLLFLCSPHNPTGRVWSATELARIGDICFQNNVFVVSDEIHGDLTRRGATHLPFAKLFPNQKRLIVCTAPSKTFNIAGNQHANLIIPDERIRAEWTAWHYCGLPTALSIDATRAAYDYCEDWLEQLRGYLDGNFAFAQKYLAKHLPTMRFYIPEGTYLAWPDFSAAGISDEEANRRVSQAGVFVEFKENFVHNAESRMRINMACPRSVLEWSLQRIATALGGD